MCMRSVSFSFETDKDYGVGYKAYEMSYDHPDRLIGSTTKFCNDISLRRGRWYSTDERRFGITAHDAKKYQVGFHIFLDKKDAETYYGPDAHVVQVRFKDVVAFGTNNSGYGAGPCIIARKMYIVDDKPKTLKTKAKNGRKTA